MLRGRCGCKSVGAKCFSLLCWTGYQSKIRVPYGSLVDAPTLRPMAHMFVGSKAAWCDIRDELPQHEEYPWPAELRGSGGVVQYRLAEQRPQRLRPVVTHVGYQ